MNFKRFARKWLRPGRATVIAVPYFWLLLFFAVPFLIVLKISFAEQDIAIPPFTSLLNYEDGGLLHVTLNLANFQFIFGDELYADTYLSSLRVAFFTTVMCLLIGYPIAYAIARTDPARRNVLLMLVMLPFWTSFLLRVYAWMGLLKPNGIINHLLMSVGLISEPLEMFHNTFSLYLVMVYAYLPFMILPLYAHLVKMDIRLLEAANDLGARPLKAFFAITLPLSKNGIIAGSMMVFIPAVGEFVIPELVGGPDTLMIGKVLWNEFFDNNNWPMAAAVATVMVLLLIVPIGLFHRYETRELEGKNV
ncbi:MULTISPECIES: ABC transporter permease subunit [Gulbenkiania]|uniref:ABC-type spermidine/putrescine transport system, permease component I n=1 Tax=Gulbenkiania indica TaxID=375574 RepID=A0A0K6H5S7_9NEIS|nr:MULTISPECIES: ABC transporter permease subunit [Gulbenkiania]CUA86183.1 ABC-type spermidine/putrescine transport system, permease component I [Gulbenkiania indica]